MDRLWGPPVFWNQHISLRSKHPPSKGNWSATSIPLREPRTPLGSFRSGTENGLVNSWNLPHDLRLKRRSFLWGIHGNTMIEQQIEAKPFFPHFRQIQMALGEGKDVWTGPVGHFWASHHPIFSHFGVLPTPDQSISEPCRDERGKLGFVDLLMESFVESKGRHPSNKKTLRFCDVLPNNVSECFGDVYESRVQDPVHRSQQPQTYLLQYISCTAHVWVSVFLQVGSFQWMLPNQVSWWIVIRRRSESCCCFATRVWSQWGCWKNDCFFEHDPQQDKASPAGMGHRWAPDGIQISKPTLFLATASLKLMCSWWVSQGLVKSME